MGSHGDAAGRPVVRVCGRRVAAGFHGGSRHQHLVASTQLRGTQTIVSLQRECGVCSVFQGANNLCESGRQKRGLIRYTLISNFFFF